MCHHSPPTPLTRRSLVLQDTPLRAPSCKRCPPPNKARVRALAKPLLRVPLLLPHTQLPRAAPHSNPSHLPPSVELQLQLRLLLFHRLPPSPPGWHSHHYTAPPQGLLAPLTPTNACYQSTQGRYSQHYTAPLQPLLLALLRLMRTCTRVRPASRAARHTVVACHS